MNNTLIVDIINITLSSLEERSFLLQLKRVLSGIFSEDEGLRNVNKLINIILNKDIKNVNEALYEVDALFESDITSLIDLKANKYSSKYRESFLKKLNIEKFIAMVNAFTMDIDENISKLKVLKSDKTKSKIIDIVHSLGKEFFESLTSFKVTDGSTRSIILDPYNRSATIENLLPVIEQSAKVQSSVIKTFPAMDAITDTGLRVGTLTLLAAKPAGFKSGVLQNICISASINNDISKFNVPNGKIPSIFLISMENTERQLYERHVSYFHNSMKEAEEKTKNMTNEELANYVSDLLIEHKAKLPIIYLDRVGKQTTMSDIASDISEYEQLGYYPILIGVDYLVKLTPSDPAFRVTGLTGAEGGARKKQIAKEFRDYAISKSAAAVLPEQLSTDAVHDIEMLRSDCRKIDPLFHVTLDCIAGSRDLANELDNAIFIYLSEIPDLQQDSDVVCMRSYISLINMKSREHKGEYVLSNRDKINMPLYDLQVRKLKNGPLREKFKDTGHQHAVSPLINYRIDLEDYAKSIIMYYTSDNTDPLELKTLMEDSSRILTDVNDVFTDSTPRDTQADFLGL